MALPADLLLSVTKAWHLGTVGQAARTEGVPTVFAAQLQHKYSVYHKPIIHMFLHKYMSLITHLTDTSSTKPTSFLKSVNFEAHP